MNLQTTISLVKQPNYLIDYNSNILLLGSCFVENLGAKLSYFKFQNLQNPFGIIFQPKAIESIISNAINEKHYSEKDVFFLNEQWHCFEAHSRLSASSKDDLLATLNEQNVLTSLQLKKASHVIITLGTAWVYRFIKSDTLVANCHKIPQKQFNKELLSVDEVSKSLQSITHLIESINPKAAILFTVSPVRHIKDGFIENTQSKAHLLAAIHQYLNSRSKIINHHSFYFPSYEIMMDELRDYRFYAEDMVHPSKVAIQYIWEKFQEAWISNDALQTMNAVEAIQKRIQHKPYNPNSEAHQKFLQKSEVNKMRLSTQFHHIKF